MNKTLLVIFSLVGAALLPACGSSSSGSSSCAPPSGATSSPACTSCVESSCSSQYSEFCSASCSTNSSSSACTKAAEDVGACVIQNCLSQCNSGEGTGGATSTAGGATSTAGGSSIGTGGGTAGEERSYCYEMAQGLCTVTTVPAGYKSTIDMACVSGGGTAPDSCPTAGLVGCCTIASVAEECSYSGAGAGLTQTDCAAEGGTWSTTP